ncbi:MAG TPA: hypothetical protein VNO21_08635 [Polyangiaceae bacterium]|nr:hypothetical protein [Polyangiaceae bacterium]
MKEKEKDVAVRIMNQFRDRGSMVYELRHEGSRFAIVTSQRTSGEDPNEWQVRVRVAGQPAESSVERWGSTRIDALRAVAQVWRDEPAGWLSRLDWEAVEKALLAVRAL